MTPEKPMACIYAKWYRGIMHAVPDPVERCALFEYVVQYQLHAIYGAAEQPSKDNLPQAARIAADMLEGDLIEFCASRINRNEQCRRNGRRAAAGKSATAPNVLQIEITYSNGTKTLHQAARISGI